MAFDSDHWTEIERRDDAARRALTSSLSNAKWRRLIAGLEESGLSLPVCEWRFLRGDHWFRWSTPKIHNINDTGVLDHGGFQPFLFKGVEQVRWPRHYEVGRGRNLEPWRRTQDIRALEEALKSIGQFDYEIDETALTLFAYR